MPKPAPVQGTTVKAGGTPAPKGTGTAPSGTSGSTTFEAKKGGEVKINVDNTVAGGDGGSVAVKGEKPVGEVTFEAGGTGGDAAAAGEASTGGSDTFDIDAEADTGFEANGFGAEADASITVDANFSI